MNLLLPQGISFLRKKIPEILGEENDELTSLSREIFVQLYEYLQNIDQKCKTLGKHIEIL